MGLEPYQATCNSAFLAVKMCFIDIFGTSQVKISARTLLTLRKSPQLLVNIFSKIQLPHSQTIKARYKFLASMYAAVKKISADMAKKGNWSHIRKERVGPKSIKRNVNFIQIMPAVERESFIDYNMLIEEGSKNKFVFQSFWQFCKYKLQRQEGKRLTKHMGNGNRTQLRRKLFFSGNLVLNKNIQYKNNTRGQKLMLREEQYDAISAESNQSVQFQYLTTKIFEQLNQSHQLGKAFIAELGDLKTTPLLESLASYCKEMKLGLKSWETILELMEARLTKMIKNNKLKKNWSSEDLQILVWLLSKYMEKQGIPTHEDMTKDDWIKIAQLIPGATGRNCMFKFVSLKKFKLAHHKWQKDQENLLLSIIQQLGPLNWKSIAQKLYDRNNKKRIFRTAKQCRQHWSCYLDPKIKKGPWQRQEDRKLLQIVLESSCNKRWSAIKLQFEGRTQNALKNRFNLLLEKQKKLTPNKPEKDLISQILKEETHEEPEQEQESSIKQSERSRPPSSAFVPLVPEERRNINFPFHPNLIFFFPGNSFAM